MNFYLVIFKNTLDAMNAERKFEESNLTFKMVPTPTAITQSCGICIRFDDKSYIEKVKEGTFVEYKSIYEKDSNGYVLIA